MLDDDETLLKDDDFFSFPKDLDWPIIVFWVLLGP